MAGAAFSVVVNIGAKIGPTFGASIGAARRQFDSLGASVIKAQAANAAKRSEYRAQIGDAVALGTAMYGLIKPAVDFESNMADVRKVVDFDSPEQFKRMGDDIVAMSQRLPMAASGLSAIVAAAGQSGIAKDELLGFAEAAAKMGIAFDISAGEAGETMAKWRTALKLTQPQVESLADAVNELSNVQASKAGDIADVLRRIGGLSVTTGLGAKHTAALGSAMLSAGATSDVAATGLKHIVMSMSAGTAATKKQRAAFEELGLDANNMAQAMQKNAPKAIMTVFEAIQKLKPEKQGAILHELFGLEAIGSIAPLLTNLDNLRQAFGLVGDESKYAGSMEKEFAARSATTANAFQLMKNRLTAVSITVGTILLPAINDVLAVTGPLVTKVADLAGRFPGVTKVVAGTTVGLIGLKLAAIGAGYGFALLKGGALVAARSVLFSAGLVQTATRLMFAPYRMARALVMGAARQVVFGFALMRAGAIGFGGLASGAFTMAGRAMLGLLNPMALVRGALFALRLAVIGTGIGAIVVGLAMAGTWIYQNWSNLAAMFEGFGAAFMAALGPAAPAVEGLGSAFGRLWSWVSGIVGPIEGAEGAFRAFGGSVGAVIGGAVASVLGFVNSLTPALSSVAAFAASVGSAFVGMVAAALPSFSAIADGFRSGVIGGISAAWAQFSPARMMAAALNELLAVVSGFNLFESGRALLSTFCDGITSLLDRPKQLIRGAFESLGGLFPNSDAKEGPLSGLTKSGAAILPTLGEGVAKAGPGPLAGALSGALAAALTTAGASPAMAGAPGGLPLPPAAELAAVSAPAGGARGATSISIAPTITVNGATGSPNDIAAAIRDEIEQMMSDMEARRRSLLTD